MTRPKQMTSNMLDQIFDLDNAIKINVNGSSRVVANSDNLPMPIYSMADPDRDDDGDGTGAGLLTKTKPKTKKPSMYKVLLLNDDYTPMEFVVFILENIFNKGQEDAVTIMLHVHQKGVGVCGVYPYEIAETKVTQVMELARREQHPLQCTLEKD